MTLVQLQCFLSVSRTLNFTRSAEELFFTQSNLSKNVAALEKELGFQLFQRNSHSVQLTEQGACFAREIQDVPDLVTRAAAAAREVGKLQSSILRVGVMEGYEIAHSLTERFYRLQREHPQLTLHYERYGFRELAERLENDQLDLVITLSQLGPVGNGIDHLLLERAAVNLVLSRRNPLSRRDVLTLADCSGETLVTLQTDQSYGSINLAFQALEHWGCQPGQVVECPNVESQFLELEMGDGFSILDARCRVNHSPYVVTYPIRDMEYEMAAYWKKDGPLGLELLVHELEKGEKTIG